MSKCECAECNKSSGPMFMHSKCCSAHWELVKDDYGYFLCCEKCGKILYALVFIDRDLSNYTKKELGYE